VGRDGVTKPVICLESKEEKVFAPVNSCLQGEANQIPERPEFRARRSSTATAVVPASRREP
jgi:hypothetical protein